MYQQNRPQMPMPGMMNGVSPLSGLTDGENIMAEEERMGRAGMPMEQQQQPNPALDRYRMEQFQQMFDQEKNKYDPLRKLDQLPMTPRTP